MSATAASGFRRYLGTGKSLSFVRAQAVQMPTTAVSSTSHNFFARCWRGSAPLWQAFWFCGIGGAGGVLLAVPKVISAASLGAVPARLLFATLAIAYASFASVAIWRCAGTDDVSPLQALAKVYAVVSLLSWVALTFFALTFQE